MRFQLWTLFGVLALTLVGCGGGGTGNGGGFQPRTDPFSVAANEGFDKTYGEIGIKFEAAGTFPNGSSLALYQTAQAPQLPPEQNFVLGKPALKLTSSETPQKDITISVIDDGKEYIAGIKSGDVWLPLDRVKSNGKVSFTLPAALGRSADRGGGKVWEWVIGLVKDNLSDTEYAIKKLEGTTNFADPGTILCFHGVLDNYQSMKTIGSRARVILGGSNVFSFASPWKQGAKEAGIQLAALLAPYKDKLKNVTFVGYSQGELTARYALERLGATASVRNLVSIVGPNKGSHLADTADFAFNISKLWLNGTFSCSPFTADVDDPAIEELRPGSAFLTELNSYHSTQRGVVTYHLFAGGKDWVVERDSALANGIQLGELTGGPVYTYDLPSATHFNIKSDTSLIDSMFNSIRLTFDNELSIWTIPSTVEADSYGWYYVPYVRNNTSSSMLLKVLTFDNFGMDSSWLGVQWYDPYTPTGEFFPSRYAEWNVTLGPGETFSPSSGFFNWASHDRGYIWNAPVNQRAQTTVLSVIGMQDGRLIQASCNVVCNYDTYRPSPPDTRGGRSHNGTGLGLMGPAPSHSKP